MSYPPACQSCEGPSKFRVTLWERRIQHEVPAGPQPELLLFGVCCASLWLSHRASHDSVAYKQTQPRSTLELLSLVEPDGEVLSLPVLQWMVLGAILSDHLGRPWRNAAAITHVSGLIHVLLDPCLRLCFWEKPPNTPFMLFPSLYCCLPFAQTLEI